MDTNPICMAEVTDNPRQKQSSIDCLDVEWPVIRQGLFACPFNGYQVKVSLSTLGEQAGLYWAASLWE